MEHEEILECLAEMRRIAQKLRAQTNIPTLDRAMSTVDTYCHMMQWQLGGTHEPVPALHPTD